MKTEQDFKNQTDKNPKFKFDGNYRALVVDDEDPRDIGRIKVRVMGVHREDVVDEDLPWAIPACGVYRSGGENMKPEKSVDLTQKELSTAFNDTGTGGIFAVPARGNHVWVWFDMGNHQYPVYFAMAPGEMDWLTQKQYVKDKIANKLEQIKTLKSKFSPVNGTEGIDGKDWADGVHVNARQTITSGGEKAPFSPGGGDIGANFSVGQSEIKGGEYQKRNLNIAKDDSQGENSKNMEDARGREFGNFIGMDVKPLFDKQDKSVDHSTGVHKYDKDGKLDEAKDTARNINRYIQSFTTQGGTTIIIDNREGQENYYFIHKNYMENIDQEGSRKVFIGRNEPRETLVAGAEVNDDRNKGPDPKVRSNDELLVDGDKKIHILGNFVTYVKGNNLIQVDKNTQIDVNETMGIRVHKGDFDIVINGESETGREKNSEREDGKAKQYGDLNIDIQKGNMEVHTKKNINVHAEGQVNLRADGDIRQHTLKSYHLTIDGDFCTYVGGNKYETIKGSNETNIGGNKKLQIGGNKSSTIAGKESTRAAKSIWGNAMDVNGIICASDHVTQRLSLNSHIHQGKHGPTSPGFNGRCSPSAPDSGANAGGGLSPDADPSPINNTTGVESSMSSRNKTIKAKRKHDKRKPK